MIELPDISHLTPEEQQKILGVIKRQQDEEEKEKTMLKVLHDQFEDYKSHIKMVAEDSKVTTPNEDVDEVCALCCKTKFAEGCGHICTFCEVKFCSRCGGRITIKSNKTMWVCNLCRKQKEILTKSGAWFHGENNRLSISVTPLKDLNGKEKEGRISKSALPNHINSSGEITKGTENHVKEQVHESSHPQSRVKADEQIVGMTKATQPTIENFNSKMKLTETVPSFQTTTETRKLPAVCQSVSSFDVDAEMNSTQKSETVFTATPPCDRSSNAAEIQEQDPTPNKMESSNFAQDSFDNGDSNRFITPHHCDQKYPAGKDQVSGSSQHIQTRNPSTDVLKRNSSVVSMTNNVLETQQAVHSKMQLHGCQSEPNISGSFTRRELPKDTSVHQKLMYHRQQHNRKGLVMHDTSVSSSEDDIHSTEYSSFDGGDKETSISDNDYVYSQQAREHLQRMYRDASHHFDQYVDNSTKSSTSLCSCQQSTSNNRDSGVESVSVHYDGNQHDQLPVSWQPSSDGRFLIGHLLLCKNISSTSHTARQAGALLGLKVVGGKSTPSGRLGAFITKVKKGSLADTIGHIKPGDEIISWNKNCLQDASFDEVYEIILASKEDVMVELVVSRPIKDVPRIPETRLHQTAESSSCSLDSDRRDFESNVKPLCGKIQIKILYDDKTQQLYVTAIRAVELPLREGGLPRNPYLKMYLLPDRSNTFKRRTKTAKKTRSPEWLQTFVYGDVRRDDLGAMALELTLWDYDRSLEANNKFMGEVLIDLGLVCLDDEPHWFRLMPYGHGMNQDYVMENHSPYLPSTRTCVPSHMYPIDSNDGRYPSVMGRSMEQIRTKSNHSLNSLPKRRLPHVPTTTAQPVAAVKEPVHEEIIKPVESNPKSAEPETEKVFDDCCSSKTSMEFDAVSVDRTLQTFVGGIGPGQVVGRQALAMNSVGEIQLRLYERRSQLEVQVIRARKLSCKAGTKVPPAHYVKIYMMLGVQCTAKKKTKVTTRSLKPAFHQPLVFDSSQAGNAIQVILWADYGRMDSKVFVGMAQIALHDLDLSTQIVGWYKLFPTSSLIDTSAYGSRKESYSSFGSSSQTLG